jgi:hypothetical protein
MEMWYLLAGEVYDAKEGCDRQQSNKAEDVRGGKAEDKPDHWAVWLRRAFLRRADCGWPVMVQHMQIFQGRRW